MCWVGLFITINDSNLFDCVITASILNFTNLNKTKKTMETKTYQTVKEFFKFLNDYEGEIWIRGSKAFDANGELVAEYNTKL